MSERTRLEQLAIDAHHSGLPWVDFWEQHRRTAAAIFPSDHNAYHRFARRLLAFVASGDLDGAAPIDAGYGRPFDFELEQIEGTR